MKLAIVTMQFSDGSDFSFLSIVLTVLTLKLCDVFVCVRVLHSLPSRILTAMEFYRCFASKISF